MKEKKERNYVKIIAIILLIGLTLYWINNTSQNLETLNKDVNTLKLYSGEVRKNVDELKENNIKLQIESASVKLQIKELWFRTINPTIGEKIKKEMLNLSCLPNNYGVQSTFYNLIPVNDFEYLRYNFEDGFLFYNREGEKYCFSMENTAMSCNLICLGIEESLNKLKDENG